jgi:hypothetical protein
VDGCQLTPIQIHGVFLHGLRGEVLAIMEKGPDLEMKVRCLKWCCASIKYSSLVESLEFVRGNDSHVTKGGQNRRYFSEILFSAYMLY